MDNIVSGSLDISILIECPHCNNIFDLFEDELLTDEGWIYEIIFDEENWGRCKDFSSEFEDCFEEKYKCPECKEKITIKEIEY